MKLNRIYILFALLLASTFNMLSVQPANKSNTRDVIPAGGGASHSSTQSQKFKNFSTVGEGLVGSHSSSKFKGTVGFLSEFGQVEAPIVANIEEVYTGAAATDFSVSNTEVNGASFEWYSNANLNSGNKITNGISNSGRTFAHGLIDVGTTDFWVVQIVGGTMSSATKVTVKITPKSVDVISAVATARAYDGTDIVAITGATLDLADIADTDEANLNLVKGTSGTIADIYPSTTAKAVTTDMSLGGTRAANYTIVQPTGITVIISQLQLTMNPPTVLIEKVYDGNPTVANPTVGSIINKVGNDAVNVAIASAEYNSADVKTANRITVKYSINGDNSGYYTAPEDLVITEGVKITPKPITFTVSGNSLTYSGVQQCATVSTTESGVVGTDYTVEGNCGTDAVSQNPIEVTIINTNYSVANNPVGYLNIGRKTAPTIVFNDFNATYGDDNVAVSYNGGGDGTVSYSSNATGVADVDANTGDITIKKVGQTTITVSITQGTNYNSSSKSAVLTVGQKDLNVSNAVATVRTYDNTKNVAISGAVLKAADIESGDESKLELANHTSGTVTTVTAENDKAVTTAMTLSGDAADNYHLIQPSDLTVSIAKVLLTMTTAPTVITEKVYDGLVTAAVTNIGVIGGLIPADNGVIVTPIAEYSDENVGENKAITITYSIAGDKSENYLDPVKDVTTYTNCKITKKSLTLIDLTAKDKEYDGDDIAEITGTPALSGDINGDVLTINGTAVGAFENKNIGTNKKVIVSGINIGGADAGNYDFKTTDLTADITAKALTVENIAINSKDYDGTTTATISNYGTLSGVLANESVSLVSSGVTAAAFTTATAGPSKAVTLTGDYSLDGEDKDNYTLTQPSGLTAEIRKVSLTATAVNKERCIGAAEPEFTILYTGLVNNEDATVVDEEPTSTTTATLSSPAATYPITLIGGLDDNYTFDLVDGELVVTPAAVGGIISGLETIIAGQSTGTLTLADHYGIVTKWQRKMGSGAWHDVLSADAEYNTDKTSMSQILVNAGIYFYRAVVQSGSCAIAYSEEKSIIVTSENAIVVLSTTQAISNTNTAIIPVTATFNKTVEQFIASEITVSSNANISDFAVVPNTEIPGSVYQFNVNAISQGIVTVSINGGVAIPLNDPSNELEIIYEANSPTIVSATLDENWTSANSVIGSFTASDAVTPSSGLDRLYYSYLLSIPQLTSSSSFISIENGSAEMNFDLEGDYILQYMVSDKAGNMSDVGSKHVRIDRTMPLVLDNIPTTVQNSEGTINFYPSDNLSGIKAVYYTLDGTAPNSSSNNNRKALIASPYSFATTTISGNSATIKFCTEDNAGNMSEVISKNYQKNTTAPSDYNADLNGGNVINSANKTSVSFAITAKSADASASLYWEIYNSASTNMKLNGTISELTKLSKNNPGVGGDTTYTLSNIDLSALQDGNLELKVKLTGTNGIVGTFVTAAPVAKDVVAPTVTITRLTPSPTSSNNGVQFTATFSEDVTGVDATDFVINGGATGLSISNPDNNNVYTITVNNVTSTSTLTMTTTGITDAVGNALASPTYFNNSVTYAPAFIITSMEAQSEEGTKASIVYFGVTFNQHISNLRTSYFGVLTGDGTAFEAPATPSVVSLNTADNKTWTVGVSGMNRTGTVRLTMNCGACSSTAGILLSGGSYTSTSANYDITNPEITLHTPESGANNVSTNTPLIITFNENIVKNTDVGYIKLYEKSTGNLLQTIDVRSDYVSVNNNVLTIETANNLLPGAKDISVIIDGACFKDEAGNFFAAMTNDLAGRGVFYFTTSLGTPATISNLTYVTKTARTMRFTYRLPAGANALVLVKTNNSSTATVPTIDWATDNSDFNSLFPAVVGAGNNAIAASAKISYLASTTANEIDGILSTGSDWRVAYKGSNTDITISGLTASKYYRIYVLTYNTDGTNYAFNRTLPTSGNTCISQKTNAFKIGAEDDENGIEINGNFNVSDVTPNPVDDEINLKVDSYEGSNFSFTVYNMAGQELYTTMQLLNKGMNQVTIPVEKLGFVSSGSYMIRVSDASGETIVPFVINR